jgi:hypothetical protein
MLATTLGRGRPQFAGARIGVGLLRQRAAVGVEQVELVAGAFGHARQEQLPDTALAAQAHRMAAPVPVVEVTDDADPRGVGRPDRERGAGDAVHHPRRRAEDLVRTQVRTFAEQPDVHLTQDQAEAVRVFRHRAAAVLPVHLQLVARRRAGRWQQAFEDAIGMQHLQWPFAAVDQGSKGGCPGQPAPQRDLTTCCRLRPQHGERVAVRAPAQGFDIGAAQHQLLAWMPHTVRAYSAIVRSEEK